MRMCLTENANFLQPVTSTADTRRMNRRTGQRAVYRFCSISVGYVSIPGPVAGNFITAAAAAAAGPTRNAWPRFSSVKYRLFRCLCSFAWQISILLSVTRSFIRSRYYCITRCARTIRKPVNYSRSRIARGTSS